MDAVKLLLMVLSFAHAAVQSDAAWEVLYNEMPDEAEGMTKPPSEELRQSTHLAIDMSTLQTELAGGVLAGNAQNAGNALGGSALDRSTPSRGTGVLADPDDGPGQYL